MPTQTTDKALTIWRRQARQAHRSHVIVIEDTRDGVQSPIFTRSLKETEHQVRRIERQGTARVVQIVEV